jgi:hypothetical protein
VAIKLTDLIDRVPPEVEAKVRRVRDQVRLVVQQALRAERRLVLRTQEESEQNRSGAQVPIEVAPGYPVVVKLRPAYRSAWLAKTLGKIVIMEGSKKP